MLDEKKIVNGCCKNERKAQKMLFDKYASILLGVCIRYSDRRDVAEDILQDGFVKIFTKIKDFRGKGALVNWMKKIMINTAITHYHRNIKHQRNYDIEDVRETHIIGNITEDHPYTREELMEVIRSLPRGYRIVFNLYAIEGYKHKEIAVMLDIDINTSKSQYSRARQLIRKKLQILEQESKKTDG